MAEMPAEVQTGDRTDEESWSTVSHRVWHGVGLSVSETADVLPFPTNISEFTEKIQYCRSMESKLIEGNRNSNKHLLHPKYAEQYLWT